MSRTAKTIELVQGSGDVQHAVIWLHGLGASANDFPPIVPELGLDSGRAIRFIFPQAPDRPITINGGMSMPGWYDIKGANIEDKQDVIGMGESQVLLEELIQRQVDLGIASSNIIIAGFSQGGAVVYHTGLRSKHQLAGMLTLSTYLPFAEQVPTELNKINSDTPIFASHGSYDAMVPFEFGKNSADTLSKLGYQVQWRSYPMEHQVVMEQIQDIGAWINKVFSE
jgi:phospholipase/carboxylesterase